MAVAMIGPKFYAWDRNGKPLAFGKLYTYQARTNTPKPTYQSEDKVVENTNPVILNGEGYANIYLDGSYKIVLKDDKENEIWTSDPVSSGQAEEWQNCMAAEYVSATEFRVFGNFTSVFDAGRSLRLSQGGVDYDYTAVQSSLFAGGYTNVIVIEGVVNVGITQACTAITSKNSMQIGDYKKVIVSSNDVPAGNNPMFIRQLVEAGSDPSVTLQIQRQANSETSENPKAIRAITTIASGVDSVEWAISGELENNSSAVNGGAAALSGVSIKNAKGNTFAGHFQVKDTQGVASSIGGAIIGQELNIQANGADDNEVRIGYDIIARTYAPNWPVDGSGDFHVGVRIRNSEGVEGGKWLHGMIVEDGTQAIPIGASFRNSPGTIVGAAIEDEGDKARGLDMRGQYGIAGIDFKNANLTTNDTAIRLKDRAKIEFTDNVTLKWEGSLGTPTLQLDGVPQETAATAGAASALPANPKGYLRIHLNGGTALLPFYNS